MQMISTFHGIKPYQVKYIININNKSGVGWFAVFQQNGEREVDKGKEGQNVNDFAKRH